MTMPETEPSHDGTRDHRAAHQNGPKQEGAESQSEVTFTEGGSEPPADANSARNLTSQDSADPSTAWPGAAAAPDPATAPDQAEEGQGVPTRAMLNIERQTDETAGEGSGAAPAPDAGETEAHADRPRTIPSVVPAGPQELRLVPPDKTIDSRYRTLLPFAPDSQPFVRLRDLFLEHGQLEPLRGREVDGRFEIMGDELAHDVVRNLRHGILISVVIPENELEAYRYSHGTSHRNPKPCAWDNVTEVASFAFLREQGCTQADIGLLLGVDHSTVSRLEKAYELIPPVLTKLGIDQKSPLNVNRLRKLSSEHIRWVIGAHGPAELETRLRDVLLGDKQLYRGGNRSRRQPGKPAGGYEFRGKTENGIATAIFDIDTMTEGLMNQWMDDLRKHLKGLLE